MAQKVFLHNLSLNWFSVFRAAMSIETAAELLMQLREVLFSKIQVSSHIHNKIGESKSDVLNIFCTIV